MCCLSFKPLQSKVGELFAGLVKEEEIAEASGSIQKDEDSAASQPSMEVEKEDWLERMRRRDAELQARIAKHDATMYGRTD